jgi:hypothetical protein
MSLVVFAAAGASSLADDVPTRTIHAQPSFVFATKEVEVAVTQRGGQMAPVTFFRDSAQPVQPYYVSPWQDEKSADMPAPVLVCLRGDFFCLPFGGNDEMAAGEKHPPHGEIVGETWRAAGLKKTADVTTLTLDIETKVRRGHVTNELSLVDGQNVVYSRTTIEGFAGRAPLGHHATLAMPEKEGAVRVATSAFKFGMTCPSLFSDPKQREYQALLPGAKWTELTKVPVAWKNAPDADLTRLPARYGYADLIQLANEPWEKTGGPAWTAATFPEAGYLWFSLKDPAVLRSTVFWMENHGRHGHPWNGRNNCLGLEDVTAFFADGLAASTRENALTKEGVETAVNLTAAKPTVVNYIQGVVKIPPGFDNVKTLEFAPGTVTFISAAGQKVAAPVRHEFLMNGYPAPKL